MGKATVIFMVGSLYQYWFGSRHQNCYCKGMCAGASFKGLSALCVSTGTVQPFGTGTGIVKEGSSIIMGLSLSEFFLC